MQKSVESVVKGIADSQISNYLGQNFKLKMFRVFLTVLILSFIHSTAVAQFGGGTKCTVDLSGVMGIKKDSVRTRGMADNYHTWDPGTILTVKFMPGGSKTIRDKVMTNAREWEKYANVRFLFVDDNTSFTHLRIKLGKGSGHNSAIGTEANYREQNEPTINFDTLFFADAEYYAARLKKRGVLPPYNLNQLISEMRQDPNHWNLPELRRVVMHEFGHALGLLHEQSYPGVIKWKRTDSIYQYYRETQGWNRQQVDFNVFDMGSQFSTNSTNYDPKSIMHYAINSWETTDGYTVKNNFELSAGDKTLIAALYPKGNAAVKRIVPKVTITEFTELEVEYSEERGGLIIKPSFNLKTNSKLGEVYFVARLIDERGYFIRTNNSYYNWGGNAAAYLKMNLLPNSKVSYNKGTRDNMELFFPLRMFPDLYGRRIKVAFAVYLDDVANNQMDKLMYFSATNTLSIPTRSFR